MRVFKFITAVGFLFSSLAGLSQGHKSGNPCTSTVSPEPYKLIAKSPSPSGNVTYSSSGTLTFVFSNVESYATNWRLQIHKSGSQWTNWVDADDGYGCGLSSNKPSTLMEWVTTSANKSAKTVTFTVKMSDLQGLGKYYFTARQFVPGPSTMAKPRVHVSNYSNLKNFTLVGEPDITHSSSGNSCSGSFTSKTFSTKISNIGSATATGFYVRIYASTNSTISTSDTYIGMYYVSSLSAGSSYSKNATFDLSNYGLTGGRAYYFGYVADYSNKVSELNELNNSKYLCSENVPAIKPDLKYNSSSNSCSSSSSSASTSFKLENSGGATSSSVSIGYYLSSDRTITTSDKLIATKSVGTVSGSSSQTVSMNLLFSSINTSGLAAGTYYVGYIIDYSGSISESNENNNSYGYSCTYTVSAPPDLKYNSSNNSCSSSSSSASTSFKLENSGGTTGSSVGIGYYLSSDRIITTSDKLIATKSVGTVSGSSSQTVSMNILFSSINTSGLAAGTYYVGYIIDYSGSISESNENNNSYGYSCTYTVSAPPDLKYNSSNNSCSSSSSSASTSFKLENSGGSTGSSVSIGYYLSSDRTITTSDKLIATKSIGTVSGSSSQTVTMNLLFSSINTSGLSAGTYYVGYIIDYSGSISESNENNNSYGYSCTYTVSAASDLKYNSSNNSCSSSSNSASTSFKLENSGGSTGSSVSIGYYLSSDRTITTSDKLIATKSIGAVSGSSSQTVTMNLLFSSINTSGLSAGTYYVGYIIDYSGSISESNENNNSYGYSCTYVVSRSSSNSISVSRSNYNCVNGKDTVQVKKLEEFGVSGSISDTHIDDLGNFYVSGSNLKLGSSTKDIVAAKFSSTGRLIWSKSINGGGSSTSFIRHRIKTDSNYNVYVALNYDNSGASGTSYTLDFGDSKKLTSSTNRDEDIAIIKYDSSGKTLWVNKLDKAGTGTELMRQLLVTPKGEAFVLNESWTAKKSFIVGYYANGTKKGEIEFNTLGTSSAFIADMQIDDSNHLVTGGIFFSSYTFSSTYSFSSSGYSDAFLAKYDVSSSFSNSDIEWVKSFGGNDIYQSSPHGDWVKSIAVDPAGSIYVTGQFESTMKLAGSSLVAEPNPKSSVEWSDGFIAKFDALGNAKWASRFGGEWADYGNFIMYHESDVLLLTTSINSAASKLSFGSKSLSLSYSSQALAVDTSGQLLSILDTNGLLVDKSRHERQIRSELVLGLDDYWYIGFCDSVSTGPNSSKGSIVIDLVSSKSSYDIAEINSVQSSRIDSIEAYYFPKDTQWVMSINGGAYEYAVDVAHDSKGHSYVFGHFSSKLTVHGVTYNSKGGRDLFLIKYKDTAVIWVRTYGSSSNDYAGGISVDQQDHVLIAGIPQGTINLGSGTLSGKGSGDIAFARIRPNGTTDWAKLYGSSLYDEALGICTDDNANVYVTGGFSSSVSFGSYGLTASGSEDIFILKLDSNGSEKWAVKGGGTGGDIGYGLGYYSNYIYLVGTFQNSISFSSLSLSSYGSTDVVIAKFASSNGAVNWIEKAGSTSHDQCGDIGVNSSGIHISGAFQGTATFNSKTLTSNGNYDCFLAKYSFGGVAQNVVSFGGSNDDKAYGLALDANGNVYSTGYTIGTTGATIGTTSIPNASSRQIFVAKHNGSLLAQNAVFADSPGWDQGNAITTNSAGDILSVGNYVGTTGFNGVTIKAGSNDGYLWKIPKF